MEADNDRLESKTAGAQVIDLAAVRNQKEADDKNAFSFVTMLRDPIKDTQSSLIVIALVLIVFWVLMRRA